MAFHPINPVEIKTLAGEPAIIVGVEPGTTDQIHGIYRVRTGPWQRVTWDKNGIARDKLPICNIDVPADVLNELSDAEKDEA